MFMRKQAQTLACKQMKSNKRLGNSSVQFCWVSFRTETTQTSAQREREREMSGRTKSLHCLPSLKVCSSHCVYVHRQLLRVLHILESPALLLRTINYLLFSLVTFHATTTMIIASLIEIHLFIAYKGALKLAYHWGSANKLPWAFNLLNYDGLFH